jgi:hypothetical protein
LVNTHQVCPLADRYQVPQPNGLRPEKNDNPDIDCVLALVHLGSSYWKGIMVAVLFPRPLRNAYRAKMVTDMSFRATVIAVKFVFLATALFAVFAFAFSNKFSGPRPPAGGASLMASQWVDGQ